MRLKVQHYDVAIIGGGLVGASFARSIVKLGLKVVLIDRAPATELYNATLDNRGLAISYSTKRILDNLELWPQLAPHAYAIESVHVSEQKCFGFTKLTAASCNLPALGYVVSASQLGAALIHGIETLPNLSVLRPANIETLRYEVAHNTWQIVVQGQNLNAKLLVAADGSDSNVRKIEGITANVKNYDQSALITNIGIKQKVLTTAYERFTDIGVLAVLPFGQAQAKCIWTMDNAKISNFMQLSDQNFLVELQQALGYRLGKLLSVSQRKSFPIIYSYVEQLYGNAMVLLGNAANTLHPVAAQGFNLGVRDAMILSKVLQQAVSANEAINSNVLLKKYSALRETEHIQTRSFSNNLVEIFAAEAGFIKLTRRLGLVATQFLPGLKQRILNQGIGRWI